MNTVSKKIAVAALITIAFNPLSALAQDASAGIRQVLEQSMKDKRGITLYLEGAAIVGAVVKIDAAQWVELRSQEFGRIVVRIDRINAIAAP